MAEESVREKFPLVAPVLLCGEEAGQGLHIGARHVPTGMYRGDAVLPLRQILPEGSAGEDDPRGPMLTGGVDGILI